MMGDSTPWKLEHRTRAASTSRGTQKVTSMQVRRLLAAVLAAGSLAPHGLRRRRPRSSRPRPTTRLVRSDGRGTVHDLRPELPRGRRWSPTCTPLLLDERRLRARVKLVDTRDVYMATFPGERRRGAGVHRRHRGLPEHHPERRRRRAARPRPTPRSRSPTASRCSTTQGSRCSTRRAATDTNAFFVTQEYAERRASPRSPTWRASRSCWPPLPTARAVPTARVA